ncbi:DUF1648 domain-containing protein [Cellulomonas xiejunii]|uniref:DUF1648 domain-containing protein n=1 Tax=Cellulomonas xiejunii TaxID=2968083 RepID=A0ABY5KRW0_9CELL|nr:DUF1648 domain-containing protein [Cellulomonas xiejunii]MCC2321857.1 DUF1648 domain-containing protein [Cellulomonas xiejunii]UUI73160.1 DUF1648 domain-containing protein [Cellulomonas xiejunii]
MTAPRPTPPHRLATTVTTLVVPLLLLLATVVVALSWTPRLPDPLAVHWDASMRPDGFGSLKDAIAIPLLFVPLFALGMWALAFWAGRDDSVRRLSAGFATGLAVLVSVVVLGSLSVQLDLADAADAPGIGHVTVWAFGGGILAGVLAALVVPRGRPMPSDAPVDPSAPRTNLAPGEPAAWSRSVTSPAGAWVGAVAVLVNVVLALVLRTPAMLLVGAGIALLLVSTLVLHVSVDGRGLVARSPLGWPAVRVPLDEVVAARATQVDPFGEFGGWGYRVGAGGRAGFVLRKGEAIQVERTGGRVMVVTVDDAPTAAALLNTLADRARSTTTAR